MYFYFPIICYLLIVTHSNLQPLFSRGYTCVALKCRGLVCLALRRMDAVCHILAGLILINREIVMARHASAKQFEYSSGVIQKARVLS